MLPPDHGGYLILFYNYCFYCYNFHLWLGPHSTTNFPKTGKSHFSIKTHSWPLRVYLTKKTSALPSLFHRFLSICCGIKSCSSILKNQLQNWLRAKWKSTSPNFVKLRSGKCMENVSRNSPLLARERPYFSHFTDEAEGESFESWVGRISPGHISVFLMLMVFIFLGILGELRWIFDLKPIWPRLLYQETSALPGIEWLIGNSTIYRICFELWNQQEPGLFEISLKLKVKFWLQ